MLLLLTLVVFLLFSVLPTDPARLTCGKACTPEIIEANRHRLGLDLPVWQQYLQFLQRLLTGDLGRSFVFNMPVGTLIAQKLPATLELTLIAVFFASGIGIPLGVLSAVKQYSLLDAIPTFLAIFLAAAAAVARIGDALWPDGDGGA